MLDFKRAEEYPIIMDITPEIARQLLSTSTGNRRIRMWHVNMLADSMRRGEWRVTSQGVGIDCDGNLRDAHHRLMAVIKSNVAIKSLVVMGLPLNSYEVIDTGIKRNLSDILSENKRVTDILNIAANIVYDVSRPVSIDQMRPIMDTGLYDTAKSLISFCGTTRSFYSCAPIKLAACVTIMSGGNEDFVMQQYKALCTLNFKHMSASAMSLVKRVEDKKTDVKGNKKDTIARGLRVFDVKQKDSDKSSIKPEDSEAAKAFVLSVLNIKSEIAETQPAGDETNTSQKNITTRPSKNLDTLEDELDELLSEAFPEKGSYIHKSGDRRKFAKI